MGVVSGTIDLLYRDPATGRLVVADYKTDEVRRFSMPASPSTPPRGLRTSAALREALDPEEPPRFELWFLQADRVVEVER